jgi:Vitamin B6 photo-protection and homoeostasis
MTVIQDTLGRFATILFAWKASSSLDSNPKLYKLLADGLYDLALLTDCLVPRALHVRLPLLCVSGVSRALCGIIAGGTGTTFTAHFARTGNLADVSAKRASLGTVSGLVGTLVCGVSRRG